MAPAERGGAALLAAFLLLVLMAGAALATARNVLRDLALEADAGPAAGAGAAAESGLEWFLAWAGADPDGLRAFLARLEQEPPGLPAAPPGAPGGDWAEPGDPLEQAFRVRVRRLGAWPGPAGPGEPSWQAWRVTATGTCRTRGPGTAPAFTQVRDLLCVTPPAGPEPETGDAGRPADACLSPWSVEVLARRPAGAGIH